VDPETVSPPAEPDLPAIAADLAAIETTLDELAAGTYDHDAAGPGTPPAPTPAPGPQPQPGHAGPPAP
jgi:hypothetical protein